MTKSLQLSKLWKQVHHECTIKKKSVNINAYISVDLIRDDPRVKRSGEDKEYLMMKEETPPTMVYYKEQKTTKNRKQVDDTARKGTQYSGMYNHCRSNATLKTKSFV